MRSTVGYDRKCIGWGAAPREGREGGPTHWTGKAELSEVGGAQSLITPLSCLLTLAEAHLSALLTPAKVCGSCSHVPFGVAEAGADIGPVGCTGCQEGGHRARVDPA